MVIRCAVQFDGNPHGTFFAGQTVTGRATLQTDKHEEVRAITLKVRGFAATHWTETHKGEDDRTETRIYRGREVYMASKMYLFGPSDLAPRVIIEPGRHSYDFIFKIPAKCPSSFQGCHGSVIYDVKMVLERPWKVDACYTKPFTVLKMLDLNNYRALLSRSVQTEVEKTFCCWPCGSKPMKFRLSLPKTGFAPGQQLPVGLLITNDSNVTVEGVKIALVMRVRYFCQNSSTKYMTQRFIMAKMTGEGVVGRSTKSFLYPLRVPVTPPTCSSLCRLIHIAYQVELEAKIKGWHRNVLARIPITVGSVQLADNSAPVQQEPIGSRNELLLAPPTATNSVAAAEDEPSALGWQVDDEVPSHYRNLEDIDENMPPPDYEEVMNSATLPYHGNEASSSQNEAGKKEEFRAN